MLRESKTDDLLTITELREQGILATNRLISTHANSIQTIEGPTRKATKQTNHMREHNAALLERIDLIKPVLATLKEEVANRGK